MRAAVDLSKKNTKGGKIVGGLLKFCGVLDMEGNERGSKNNYSKYRERFQDQNRLSWIEHPESHTQAWARSESQEKSVEGLTAPTPMPL